jgi:hypothetical protein
VCVSVVCVFACVYVYMVVYVRLWCVGGNGCIGVCVYVNVCGVLAECVCVCVCVYYEPVNY